MKAADAMENLAEQPQERAETGRHPSLQQRALLAGTVLYSTEKVL